MSVCCRGLPGIFAELHAHAHVILLTPTFCRTLPHRLKQSKKQEFEKDLKEVDKGIDLIVAPAARSEKLQKLSAKQKKTDTEAMDF